MIGIVGVNLFVHCDFFLVAKETIKEIVS